jgi:hypothetical protein
VRVVLKPRDELQLAVRSPVSATRRQSKDVRTRRRKRKKPRTPDGSLVSLLLYEIKLLSQRVTTLLSETISAGYSRPLLKEVVR